jgi:O-antigen ligase
MSIWLNRIIASGLLATIVFTALAFGVVAPVSIFFLELILSLLTILWALKTAIDRKVDLSIPQTAWPLAGLILLGAVQSIAWSDQTGKRISLSMDVEATRGTVIVLSFLLIFLLLAANCFWLKARLRALAYFLSIFGFALAFYGLVRHFALNGDFAWFGSTGTSSVSGTFVNRDHFAGYLELLFATPVSLILMGVVRGEQRILFGVAAILMALTVIFTLSRGGMISLAAETVFIMIMSARYFSRRNSGKMRSHWISKIEIAAVGTIGLAVVLGAIWIGPEPVINRLVTGDPNSSDLRSAQSFQQLRGGIWKDTLRIIRNNPVSGVGLGAFRTVYPIYTSRSGLDGVVTAAHNDYLQILADGGLIGAALIIWFLVVFARSMAGCLRSPDNVQAGLTLGCGAGVVGILVHSLFDFNLQLPSHAILFLLFSGVVAQCAQMVANHGPLRVASSPASPGLVREVMS